MPPLDEPSLNHVDDVDGWGGGFGWLGQQQTSNGVQVDAKVHTSQACQLGKQRLGGGTDLADQGTKQAKWGRMVMENSPTFLFPSLSP